MNKNEHIDKKRELFVCVASDRYVLIHRFRLMRLLLILFHRRRWFGEIFVGLDPFLANDLDETDSRSGIACHRQNLLCAR